MSVSLECRVPFMKKELVEYSFSLKDDVRLHGGILKGALKRAVSDELPPEILKRSKKGFSIPLHNWKSIIGLQESKQEKILKEFGVVE